MKKLSTKSVAVLMAVTLLAGAAIGGTIAWLTDKTDEVVNTFSVGDIDIDLTESETLDLKIVPGVDITKDPKATVNKDSEDCWLFVKIAETDWPSTLTYTVADGWTAGTGTGEGKNGVPVGVYYREVTMSTTEDQDFKVLKDDKVVVSDSITRTEIAAYKTSVPKLGFTAYAVQKAGNTTAADAWAKVTE